MEKAQSANAVQWPLWWATAATVVFSMIFVMGTSTAYGVPVWAFMTSAADYVSAFVLNLPFVLVVVTCAFLALVALAVVVFTVIYGAIMALFVSILVLLAPLLGATAKVWRWLRYTIVVVLYALLAYGLYLLWPIAWGWISAQIANGTGFLNSASALTLNLIGALVGYSDLSIEYLTPATYARGQEWLWALNGAFWLAYGLLSLHFMALSFERTRKRIAEARAKALEEHANAPAHPQAEGQGATPDSERTVRSEARERLERGRRDYFNFLRAFRMHSPVILACLVPLVCVVTFGAGALKGRLDRDQGVRVHVELHEGATTGGLMVASLERGVLLCDARCDRAAGPLRLYSWDLIKRVDIMSAQAAAAEASEPPVEETPIPGAASPAPPATGAAPAPAP